MEEIEWLEDDRVFILMGNYPDDDSGDPVYLGYVDGEWIELDCLVTETADGYIEEYSYVKNGKTVLYYTRI